jgi:hypothetical protein
MKIISLLETEFRGTEKYALNFACKVLLQPFNARLLLCHTACFNIQKLYNFPTECT